MPAGPPAAQSPTGQTPTAQSPAAQPAAGQPEGGPGGRAATAPARVVTLTAGPFTLTVNPVDGSEIEPRRPGTPKGRPAKRAAAARAARDAAARPPVLPGPPLPARPLMERAEERERLVRLLGRGRSVRLTGPAGSGRTALLDSVAEACAGLAPDGVVRLSGHGQHQPGELLYALYAAVHDAADERPDRTELLARVGEIGAIVLLDDLELGGTALDELLRATPECAYLLAATPDTKAPSDDSHLEEVFLGGLGKADCVLLLEAATGRALTEEETAWAADLRFASEGLPLRFVQAAALLRQRDELNRPTAEDDDEEPGVFEERPRDPAHVPLPTLAEAAAPAELLASRVSESARAALRIACALGGELPHHAHLPALVGDTHADSAVAELLGCGLITPVGPRYRLAEGVARQLEEAGYGETATEEARTAARHYAWWTGHASVTPERVAAEADAVLAALAGADVVAAVLLARTAAPAFAASLHWEAWERVLRSGAEAARKAGEVAEQAYFHHELGVLALCEGRLDRARAELEASIGLRGALADKRGTVAGRRALALVTDREATGALASPPLRLEPPAAAPGAVPPALPTAGPGSAVPPALPAAGPSAATRPLPAAGPVPPSAAITKALPATRPAPGAAPAAALTPFPSLAPPRGPSGSSGTTGTSGTSGPFGPAGSTGLPALSGASGSPVPSGPARPSGPSGTDAVTQVTPVIRSVGPGSAPSAPTTLSAVFEDAFPPLTKPAPAPAPAPQPAPAAGPESRRKTVLLAAAGVLTVAALGTVIGLALTSGEEEAPAKPAVSSTPTPVVPDPPAVPGTTGSDPAPEPGTTPPPADPADPEPAPSGAAPGQAPTSRATPPRRPETSPNKPNPPQPPTKPTPTPTPTPPDPGTPTPSQSATEPLPPTGTAEPPATTPASVSAPAAGNSPTATTT
ncbi:ATP-binding protein [Streptomyces sp. NPDC006512]|uniref:ATP-binding protein n=1 Tax=Streptomyces sp. NPDC006512 TaxID=3154307 RepID=UPI00339FAEB5